MTDYPKIEWSEQAKKIFAAAAKKISSVNNIKN